MKPTSKMSVVATSPGRPEKLPAPPFSRLLKGKSACRSRRSSSSSRASPMFVGRRRSVGEGEGDKDPGSPKVTCIGQVRIHKKKKKKNKKIITNNSKAVDTPAKGDDHSNIPQHSKQHQQHAETTHYSCYCRCFHRPDFCNPFTKLPKPKRSRAPTPQQHNEQHHQRHRRRLWRGWFSPRTCHSSSSSSSSKMCHRESREQKQLLQTTTAAEDQDQPPQRTKPRVSFACSPVRRNWMTNVDADAKDPPGLDPHGDDDEAASDDPAAPSTPPKNALLLMRCRSAPQGASPFTRRFLNPDDEPAPANDDLHPDVPPPAAGRSSGLPPIFRFKTDSPDVEQASASAKSDNNYGTNNTVHDDTCPGAEEEDDTADEDDAAAAAAVGPSPSFSSVPLILTRCKSEPAHKAAKLASAQPDSADGIWTDRATDDNTTYSSNTKGKEHQTAAVARRHR